MTIPEGVVWYESALAATNVIMWDDMPVLISDNWLLWVVQ